MEAIVGMILVAVAVVVALEFMRYCQHYVTGSAKTLMAENYAREAMEELYWSGNVETTAGWTPDPPEELTGGFTRQYNVANSSDNNYRIIKARVQWNY